MIDRSMVLMQETSNLKSIIYELGSRNWNHGSFTTLMRAPFLFRGVSCVASPLSHFRRMSQDAYISHHHAGVAEFSRPIGAFTLVHKLKPTDCFVYLLDRYTKFQMNSGRDRLRSESCKIVSTRQTSQRV